MKGLSKVEEFLIENNNDKEYRLYRCSQDGVYSVRKDIKDKTCPYCKKECPELLK